jgi:hypothetical protein
MKNQELKKALERELRSWEKAAKEHFGLSSFEYCLIKIRHYQKLISKIHNNGKCDNKKCFLCY